VLLLVVGVGVGVGAGRVTLCVMIDAQEICCLAKGTKSAGDCLTFCSIMRLNPRRSLGVSFVPGGLSDVCTTIISFVDDDDDDGNGIDDDGIVAMELIRCRLSS